MFTRFCASVAKYCLVLAVVGLCAIIACVSIQVFGRYVLNDTPTWAEALALVLVSATLRHKLELVIHALSGTFGALMAWYGAVLAESVMGYKIPTLGIPEGLNQVPVSIAGALILLFSIEHIIALVKGREVVPSWH